MRSAINLSHLSLNLIHKKSLNEILRLNKEFKKNLHKINTIDICDLICYSKIYSSYFYKKFERREFDKISQLLTIFHLRVYLNF